MPVNQLPKEKLKKKKNEKLPSKSSRSQIDSQGNSNNLLRNKFSYVLLNDGNTF